MSKYKAIKGILPKKAEVIDWSAEKIISLLQFASLALVEKENRGQLDSVYQYNKEFEEKIKNFDNPFFEEFVERVTKDQYATYASKQGKLIQMVRTVLSYVKSNPYMITPAMAEIMETSPRFSWALEAFKQETTKIGAEIVAVDNMETTDVVRNANPNQSNVTLPELQFQQSMLMLTSLMKDMLKSINKKDIKDLDAKEKLRLVIPIIGAVGKNISSKKPASLVFKKLVINSAGVHDLEKAILEYTQTQE